MAALLAPLAFERALDPVLAGVAARQGGVFLRRQARDCGYADRRIDHLLDRREWKAVRRGAYLPTAQWSALDRVGRHVAVVHAAALTLDRPAVFSHVSAAVLHGLPVLDLPLRTVHVTRTDAHGSRTEAGIQHHPAEIHDAEVVVVDGVACTSLARTVVDCARMGDQRSAIVVADAALARPALTPDLLRAMVDRVAGWPGSRGVAGAMRLADGRAENPNETLMRLEVYAAGFRDIELQVEVCDTSSRPFARLDGFLFAEGVGLEADGRAKYIKPDADDVAATAANLVVDEKRREDRIRDLGIEVIRFMWQDYRQPARHRERILAAASRARPVRG